ncbi:MAG: DeoR/GlpR transcriptional regulator [Verrucomicrobiae bacterium]|nr:DeoR/GlpR transcriptional regulator [Verrucomicrobiae bacterium]
MNASRRTGIAETLGTLGECSVGRLARKFGVSEMTVRRDLQALADEGRVLRTHGGAAAAERISFEFKFLERARERQDAKEAIARAAAALVRDGRSVLMDSGTTTLALARQLKSRRDLTILTSSLPIASELQFCDAIVVYLLGGQIRRQSPDLVGVIAEATLENVRADLAFLGADAVDIRGLAYNKSPEVARMLGHMARAAREVYVVADSSKIGRTELMCFGRITRWSGLVTDRELSRKHAAALRRAGVRLLQP